MTAAEFLTAFTRHLRVGEPKRLDLIAEVKHHLSELSTNQAPEQVLGDPKLLAHKLNRTHIGWGWNVWVPAALVVAWLTLTNALSWVMTHYGISSETLLRSPFDSIAWFINNAALWVGPFAGAMFIGQRMSRMHSPWRYFLTAVGSLAILTFVSTGVSMLHEPGVDQRWVLWLGSLEISFGVCLLLGFVALLTMVALLPRQPVGQRRQRFAVWFELLLAVGLAVAGYFLILMLSAALFQPYDTWLTEMRPQPSVIRSINDFFETGWGTIMLYAGYLVLIGRRTWQNIRRLRTQIT